MGLIHPNDLGQWQRWQTGRHPLRQLLTRARSAAPTPLQLFRGSADADLLVALDATHASVRAALLAPVEHLPLERVAVLAPAGSRGALPQHAWAVRDVGGDETTSELSAVRAVIGSGHYTAVGAVAHAVAQRLDIPFGVVQHGLLTPWSPPLPPGAHLLAWSQHDAEFWASGRLDVTASTVGSALLHRAASRPGEPREGGADLLYLGQLHAAELPRRQLARAAASFCVAHHATYRPHPSERDRGSRRQHDRMSRRGVVIDRSGRDLLAAGRAVVSVFSTGVLEAAAAGIPAWVDLPQPPAWVREVWARYGMSPFGGEPTPAPPAHPDPAVAVAAWLAGSRVIPTRGRSACPAPSS